MRACAVAAFAAASAIVCAAQDAPKFEVVSIKPVSISGPFSSGIGFQPGGRFFATNFQVVSLIVDAFREQGQPLPRAEDLLNAPAWVNSQRFTIEARTSDQLANERISIGSTVGASLIRTMLEDRFKLQAHAEMREQQVFVLKLARSDGSLGPNIHPTSEECAAQTRERTANRGSAPTAPIGPPPPGQRACGGFTMRNGSASGGGVPIGAIVVLISSALRPVAVVEQTGLTGLYDFDLTWAPEAPARASADAAASLPDAPSIFTAVQEQFGMKLESERQSRRVIVIDHIEQPTPD